MCLVIGLFTNSALLFQLHRDLTKTREWWRGV